jgi:hypothetical protein
MHQPDKAVTSRAGGPTGAFKTSEEKPRSAAHEPAMPAGQFQITSEHENPMEGVPEEVGITSQEADIGFAGGQQGQRTGAMETGSEIRRIQDPTA